MILTALGCLMPFGGSAVMAENLQGQEIPTSDLKIYRNNLTSGMSNAVEWVRVNDINPTDLSSSYTALGSSYVNVVDNDYGATGWAGLYDCLGEAEPAADGVCNHADVLLNLCSCVAPGGAYGSTEARSLVCHEFGHVLGVDHRNPVSSGGSIFGCMNDVDFDDDDYTNHDRDHFNLHLY